MGFELACELFVSHRVSEIPGKAVEVTGAGDDVSTISVEHPDLPAPTADSDLEAAKPNETNAACKYNIEFIFDCDVSCNITIMYFAKEEMANGTVM